MTLSNTQARAAQASALRAEGFSEAAIADALSGSTPTFGDLLNEFVGSGGIVPPDIQRQIQGGGAQQQPAQQAAPRTDPTSRFVDSILSAFQGDPLARSPESQPELEAGTGQLSPRVAQFLLDRGRGRGITQGPTGAGRRQVSRGGQGGRVLGSSDIFRALSGGGGGQGGQGGQGGLDFNLQGLQDFTSQIGGGGGFGGAPGGGFGGGFGGGPQQQAPPNPELENIIAEMEAVGRELAAGGANLDEDALGRITARLENLGNIAEFLINREEQSLQQRGGGVDQDFALDAFSVLAQLQLQEQAQRLSQLTTDLNFQVQDAQLGQTRIRDENARFAEEERIRVDERRIEELIASRRTADSRDQQRINEEIASRQAQNQIDRASLAERARATDESNRVARERIESDRQRAVLENPFAAFSARQLGVGAQLGGQQFNRQDLDRQLGEGGDPQDFINSLGPGLGNLDFQIPTDLAGEGTDFQNLFGGQIPTLGALRALSPEARTLANVTGQFTGTSTGEQGRLSRAVTLGGQTGQTGFGRSLGGVRPAERPSGR